MIAAGEGTAAVSPTSSPASAVLTRPTYDPFATPDLSDNPSEFESGRYLYYFHCMPCHGDLGQGLTDDFRKIWEEDHQYCWGKGCHGGRPQDEGFPIPTYVPAIISKSDALRDYSEFSRILAYLEETHPPQSPGILSENDYSALAVFLWMSNEKPAEKMTHAIRSKTTDNGTFSLLKTPLITQTLQSPANTPPESVTLSAINTPQPIVHGPLPSKELPAALRLLGFAAGIAGLIFGVILLILWSRKKSAS